MATSWTNNDGLVVYYGTRDVENKRVRKVSDRSLYTTVVLDFTYDDLPAWTQDDKGMVAIPANSWIKEAYVQTIVPIAGTTPTLTIGLEKDDGDGTKSAIDADGIDAAIAAAALSSVGEVVVCDGDLVGYDATAIVGIGSNDGYVVATTGGTVTAGEFRLVLTYLAPAAFDAFTDTDGGN